MNVASGRSRASAVASLSTRSASAPLTVSIDWRIRTSIETVKAALAERVERLSAALERELPDAKFTPPEGGYFMWVELPEDVDVDGLFTAAAEKGVAFVKGTDFLLDGGRNTLRLAYSGVTVDQIDEGVARLAEAYRAQRKSAAV